MGQLILLRDYTEGRSRAAQFIYDMACPLSYLAAEQVELSLGQVDWLPALGGLSDPAAVREEAERTARGLRLPLVWPESYPQPVLRATRAAAHAAAAGFGARFGLAALRLAFCGGFDLEDPEVLTEAAAAAGLGAEECLTAASDARFDPRLRETVEGLHRVGAQGLPAVRVGGRVFAGPQAIPQAAALLGMPAGAAARQMRPTPA
jgi:2-hydroxychromene-2-carboxylate isomerase